MADAKLDVVPITMSGLRLNSPAERARLMVAESAAILKRFYFLQRSLVLMQAGWVPGVVQWEYKLLLPEFLWEDALTAQRLRQRVLELRYPDRRIVPGEDTPWLSWWEAFSNAPDGNAFVSVSIPALKAFLRRAFVAYLEAADLLDDGPTVRILRHAIQDIDRQLERVAAAPAPAGAAMDWKQGLETAVAATDPTALLQASTPAPTFDWAAAGGSAFALARRAARDARFRLTAFAWPDRLDRTRGPGEGVELQLRAAVHHVNEVWAAEMAAAVLYELGPEGPPEFLEDGARWCYDEIRHCRMGYSRLREWGFRPEEIPLDTYSYDASGAADALVRLGTIYYFETTYIHTKPERAKIFSGAGDRLSAHDMDFDWADELIHTDYGTRWLKHFIASRGDGRIPNAIKTEAEAAVRRLQLAAGPEDREAAEAIRRSLLARAAEITASWGGLGAGGYQGLGA